MAVPGDTDRLTSTDDVRRLALEYAEARRRSDVDWLYVQQPRDGPLQYETFSYLPEQHFHRAYDRLVAQTELEPDGGYDTLHNGTRRSAVYYWLNPETGAALYHTRLNDEETIPFFPDEASAQDYLEKRARPGESDRYECLSLYKARTRKVADAIDVPTDQAAVDEFGEQMDDEGDSR